MGERERERYSMYGEKKGSYRVLVEKHEGKSNSEDLEVDGRVRLTIRLLMSYIYIYIYIYIWSTYS